MKSPSTIPEIYEACGGQNKLPDALPCSRPSPYNWAAGRGIPEEHWDAIIALAWQATKTKLTPSDLHQANTTVWAKSKGETVGQEEG